MLYLSGYAFKRISRDLGRCLLLLLTVFTLVFFICVFARAKEAQKDEFEYFMDGMSVEVALTDAKGLRTDDIIIGRKFINSFISPEHELSEYVTGVLMKRSLILFEIDNIPFDCTLTGVTTLAAQENMSEEYGTIVSFFENRDESCFSGFERVCIMNDMILENLGIETETIVTITAMAKETSMRKPSQVS